jgi:hypothetical protein
MLADFQQRSVACTAPVAFAHSLSVLAESTRPELELGTEKPRRSRVLAD